MGLQILSRVYRLLSPRSANPGNSGGSDDSEDPEDSARDHAATGKKPAGNALTIATGSAERDVLRAELRVLLREEIKRVDQDYDRRRAEWDEITPACRDSLLVPKHPQAALLARLGDSDLRQLRFITDLLMKLKDRGSKPAAGAAEPAKSAEHPTI